MAAKQTSGLLKMYVASGKASPSPPVGPALGQRGINIMQFCKEFNERTNNFKPNILLPTRIKFQDKQFSFTINHPTITYFLLQAAGLEKGATEPGRNNAGSVTLRQIYEIALVKGQDKAFQNTPLIGVCRSIIHSAHSIGLDIVNDKDGDGPLADKSQESQDSAIS